MNCLRILGFTCFLFICYLDEYFGYGAMWVEFFMIVSYIVELIGDRLCCKEESFINGGVRSMGLGLKSWDLYLSFVIY